MLRLALGRTVQAVMDDGFESLNADLMRIAVSHIDMLTRRRNDLHQVIAIQAAALASLQTKLLLQSRKGKVKLYEVLGEYFYLEGRLFAAREAFYLALR